jgi:PKD repeat protein
MDTVCGQMPETPPSSPVDGITSPKPEPAPTAPVQPSKPAPVIEPGSLKPNKKSGFNLAFAAFVGFAVIYALPALVFMAMFPRPDGSLQQLKYLATLVYGIGAVAWLLFLVVGFLRIASIKDHPRMRFFATLRLVGIALPLVGLSGLTTFLINIEPKLRLEVIAPKAAAEFVAPVSVTFGMETPLKVFKTLNLKPLKFEWDYNNDGVPDQETFDPTSTYFITKAGIFNIVAKVTMTDGTVKNVVYRLVIPRASFGLQPSQPIIDEPATFTIEHMFPKSTEATNKLLKAKWDFDGDSVVDFETDKMTASYTYQKLGRFNVTVTMILANQSQSSLQRSIEVVKPPEQPFPVTLETEPQTLLAPPPFGVLFSLKTKESIANAKWDFGNGKSAEGLRVAQVFNAVGTFVVTVAARSQSGSVAKLSKIVRVTNPLEIRDVTFEGTQVKNFTVEGEVPLFVRLKPVTQQPLISFTWDAKDAPESEISDATFQAVYRDEGKYSIDLIGVDPDQNVFRKRITITALPPASMVQFTMDPATPTAPATVTLEPPTITMSFGFLLIRFQPF